MTAALVQVSTWLDSSPGVSRSSTDSCLIGECPDPITGPPCTISKRDSLRRKSRRLARNNNGDRLT